MTEATQPLTSSSSAFEDTVKVKRLEKIMDKKTETFLQATQAILDHEEALIFEVEELKRARETLKQDVKQLFQTELELFTTSFVKQVTNDYSQQVKSLMQESLATIQKIHSKADDTVSVLQTTAIQSRKRLILMGVSLVASVCFSCSVIATVFFYFFPQKTTINYEINMEQIQHMIYGKTVIDNFKKLKPEDQALIEKETEKTTQKLFFPHSR